jgi:hypothetical protein
MTSVSVPPALVVRFISFLPKPTRELSLALPVFDTAGGFARFEKPIAPAAIHGEVAEWSKASVC